MQDSIFYHMTLKSHFIGGFLHQNIKISSLENVMFIWTLTHDVKK